MTAALAWAVGLLVAAALFCFLEVFTPSMGILTALGLCCAVGSCWAAFTVGPGTGAAFVGLNIAGIVGGFLVGFKVLPHSPLAHRGSHLEDGPYEPVEAVADLAGASGAAHTDLRPGGTALISGRKVDVVAEGGYIDRGTRVRVVRVEGTKVVVRKETA
jgi:membrane-bound serine protease (ClpP class)